ncbi:MAG: Hsp20/alpha crystallin family protein [Planctomycetota bacterium]|jgi:HSP20 family protein
MQLIPWKRKYRPHRFELAAPTHSLRRFRDAADRLLDRFSHEWTDWWGEEGVALMPTMDLAEGEKDITVRLELPGIDPEDVEVSLCGHLLTVTGEKKEKLEERKKNVYHAESRFGSFRRTIELPETADVDDVAAEIRSGVLTIRVAKLTTAAGRHIPVATTKHREREMAGVG